MNLSGFEAENAVLGGILEKGGLDEVHLEPGDFGSDANREIYRAMLTLRRRGEPLAPVTVGAELGPRLIKVADQLAKVQDSAPIGPLAPFARIVKEAAQRRRLEALAKQIPAMLEGGAEIAEVAEHVRQAIEEGRATIEKTRLTFTPASDLTMRQEPTSWIVKPYLETETLACLFAPSESLKTFLVVSLGLCVATGRPWHGQKVSSGPVLYLCGEARRNIGRRIAAWERTHGVRAETFFVSSGAAQILDPSGLVELDAAAQAVTAQHGAPALLIVDTLNRNFGAGDENNTQDMTRFIAALDHLRASLKCAILIVHHTGLADAGRGRGNSALRGALDFEYCITSRSGATIEERTIEFSCSKSKDHDRPPTMAFKPVVVDLGLVDEDMRPVTSLALERIECAPTQQSGRKQSPQQVIALKALSEAVQDGGVQVGLEEWRDAAYRLGIADTTEAKRKAFNRARTALIADGLVLAENDLYSLPGQSGTTAGHVPECPGDLAGQAGHTPLGVSRVPVLVPVPAPLGEKIKMSRFAEDGVRL